MSVIHISLISLIYYPDNHDVYYLVDPVNPVQINLKMGCENVKLFLREPLGASLSQKLSDRFSGRKFIHPLALLP